MRQNNCLDLSFFFFTLNLILDLSWVLRFVNLSNLFSFFQQNKPSQIVFALQNLGLRSAQCRVTQCNECKHWEDYLFPLYMFFWAGIWLHHLKNILLLYKNRIMEIWSSASLQGMSAAKVCSCKASMSCLLWGCCALLGSLCGVCFEMVDPGPDISAFSWTQPLHNLRHPEWLWKGLALKRCSCSTARRWMNLSAAHPGDPKAEPPFLWRCSSPPALSLCPAYPAASAFLCRDTRRGPAGVCTGTEAASSPATPSPAAPLQMCCCKLFTSTAAGWQLQPLPWLIWK